MNLETAFRHGVYGAMMTKYPRAIVSTADMAWDKPVARRIGMSLMEMALWRKRHKYSKRARLQARHVEPYKAKPGPGGRRKRRMRRRAK